MKTIYAAMRNSDTVEGCGPMVIDELFVNKKDAENYIDKQFGIMGRKAEICGNGKPWSQQESGDWEVEPMTLNEGSLTKEEKVMNKAKISALAKLKKLTPKEIEVLADAGILSPDNI